MSTQAATQCLAANDLRAAVGEVAAMAGRYAGDADDRARFPVETLEAMRRTGLLGLLVPKAFGGTGGNTADMVAISNELSRACLSTGMIFTMHCQQVAAIATYARGGWGEELLPLIARGEIYLASVTTEAGTGGHLLSSGAALAGSGDTLHLDRFAPVVTGGQHADGYLITMQAPQASSPHQLSLVYADRDQLDITVKGQWDPMGMRATHSAPLHLVGDIPASQVIGEHGGFRDIAVRLFAPLAHLGWAACWLGAADGALARTIGALREERQSRNLNSELLLHRLSSVRQRLDTVSALISHATTVFATAGDVTTTPVQLLLNAVKLTASRECPAVVDELIEIMGMRHGYLRHSPLFLERTLRDLRSAPLNYHNDRLHATDGALVLMDREVRHV